MPNQIPPTLASHNRTEVNSRGLGMAAVSGTYNMATQRQSPALTDSGASPS